MRQVLSLLSHARKAVALTGAGVSTQSGIPDFRSPDSGLWNHIDPSVFSNDFFMSHPAEFYKITVPLADSVRSAQPNQTHQLLTRLEQLGLIRGIITQNIDGLHQMAGSKKVIEPHGNVHEGYCLDCQSKTNCAAIVAKVKSGQNPPRCDRCDGLLKLNVKLFGEPMSFDFAAAVQFLSDCDLLLVIGTSLSVQPMNTLPDIVQENNAPVVIVNRRPTYFDSQASLVIHDDLGHFAQELTGLIATLPRED
ncbi:NAD-dependent deacetylase [bacterium]|nr:NAD-dependent deacetylase [bacterium]